MTLEDVVLLGRTVPVPSKKSGVSVCGVIYSPELNRLLRIYPTPVHGFISQRGTFKAHLTKPLRQKDSRDESFKLTDYQDTGKKASSKMVKSIISKMTSTVKDLNDNKQSLGVLAPEDFSLKMLRKKENADFRQLRLFDDEDFKDFKTGADFPAIPVVSIPGDSQKNFQLRDWGIFELMRKKDGAVTSSYISNIFSNKETFFLIGNHVANRTSWLIISFFSYKVEKQLYLF